MSALVDQRLAGRRIVVTGAASGIGRAIAECFAASGARVGLMDRDEAGLAETAATIGEQAAVRPCDVTQPPAARGAMDALSTALGGIDGLVNSAGISLWRNLADCSYEEWRSVMSVNLDAAFLISQAALPHLKAAGGGTIVNIASGAALRPARDFGVYATSKAALVALTRALAIDLVEHNIRANAVCPGVIHTPMVERTLQRAPDREARIKQYLEKNQMKRFGTVEEVAAAALFLTSAESSFTTGSIVSADGGSAFH
jgi:NAD(P)-dependent dehydrogenase (short-subunit alcohol dehydrogenase family)